LKKPILFFCLVVFSSFCSGQTKSPLEDCKEFAAKQPPDSLLSPELCAVIVPYLPPGESVMSDPLPDGSVATVTQDGIIHQRSLPPRLRSEIVLEEYRREIKEYESLEESNPFKKEALVLATDSWLKNRDSYCSYHPGEFYTDLSDNRQACPGARITDTEASPATIQRRLMSIPSSSASAQGTKTCQKAITFSYAQNGALAYRLHDVSAKWLDKFEKKYPNVCFLQYDAHSGQQNYLIVLSSSASAFNGLQPVFHTSTTTPVSGSGTVTNNAGSTWDFTYQGTITTTTTTQTNVPYTDRTSEFYAYAYAADGTLVGTAERSASSRQGGDPYNALGYNLTTALLSVHLKEHLLESIVKKISSLP